MISKAQNRRICSLASYGLPIIRTVPFGKKGHRFGSGIVASSNWMIVPVDFIVAVSIRKLVSAAVKVSRTLVVAHFIGRYSIVLQLTKNVITNTKVLDTSSISKL